MTASPPSGGTSGDAPADVAAALAGWVDARRRSGADEIRAGEEAVEDLSAQLRAAVRTLHEARSGLRALDAMTSADFARDAELIGRLPGVGSVDVRDDAIVVTSDPVTIADSGVERRLGAFRVELSPRSGVRVFAVDRPSGVGPAWIHPHVQADRPCLGNARVGVEKLLGAMQFVPAAEVMLGFLAVYDADTAYCDLSAWPTVG